MASFTTLTPPDNVVFSATRPCAFTFVDGPGNEIITGTININTRDVAVITGSTLTNQAPNQYTITDTQPGGSGTDWVYTITPIGGWPASPMQIVVFSSSPGPAIQSRDFTVGEGYTANHTETALDRMLDQFDGSGDLQSLASSYVDQVQALEDAATQLLHDRGINTASGVQLDGIGQIVNVTRGGLDDEDYRLRLKGELAILFSQGSLNEILTIVQLLIPTLPDGDIQAKEYYPKTLYIRPVDHILTEDPQTIASLLRRAVAAATELLFVYGLVDDDELFTLSSQGAVSETSTTLGLANNAQTTGGKFAGAK